jgi:hypothetical protein
LMFPKIKLAYAHRELHRVPFVKAGRARQEVDCKRGEEN